jgi:hypothetical protein
MMTCSAMQRGRYAAVAGGILLMAVGCPGGTTVRPPVPGPTVRIFYPDTGYVITTHVKPIPQSGDEHPAHRPPPDSLGGPYSKGRLGRDAAPTREAPVPLTPAMSDAVLAQYLDSLNFDEARDNGELALIRCPAGSGTGCSATLYIQPEIGMKKRNPTDVPPNGMVVARIINYSATATDSTYQIPPLTRAYWYVDHGPLGLRSRVFIRTYSSVSPVLAFIGPLNRTYEQCYHPPYGGPALAKFRTCGPDTYETAKTRGDAVLYGIVPNPFIHPVSFMSARQRPSRPLVTAVEALTDTELWVKCAQGCCVSG